MPSLLSNPAVSARVAAPDQRSVAELLQPLHRLSETSPNLMERPARHFDGDERTQELPRYIFVGPKGGDEPIRIGLFAAIHGDEPAGASAVVSFLSQLEQRPELAAGYCLFAYPVCNPTGFEDGTRASRNGRDLNREFWSGSVEPEVRLLEEELRDRAFHGIISLHADDTSHGLYGFVRGATLTKHLLRPALDAAARILPRNFDEMIDGFSARNGIIRESYPGVLGAPPEARPRPFEIILETPQAAPLHLQEQALIIALQSILVEYRRLMAYAPNL